MNSEIETKAFLSKLKSRQKLSKIFKKFDFYQISSSKKKQVFLIPIWKISVFFPKLGNRDILNAKYFLKRDSKPDGRFNWEHMGIVFNHYTKKYLIVHLKAELIPFILYKLFKRRQNKTAD